MKKLKLFAIALITAFAGILNVNAETVQPELAVIGGKNVLIANGVAITVEAPTTEGMGATVKWDGGSIEVPADVTIFGGTHNSTEEVNTSITVNGGTVKNVFGGGLHISKVGTANIVVNGGRITSSIMGGGYEEFTNCTLGDFNKVTEENVMSSTTKVTSTSITVNGGNLNGTMIFGGGGAHAYTGEAVITLNSYEGKLSYLIAGGSNGYTGKAEIILNDGEVAVVQSVNRGSMDTAEITINGGDVDNAYVGGETDPSVDGTFKEASMAINGGTVTTVEVGTNGGKTEDATEVAVLTYHTGTVTNPIDENEFKEENVTETITLTFSAEGETESVEIPVGTTFTTEDIETLKAELVASLVDTGYTFDDFYADEALTTKFDMTQPFNADTTVYMKLVKLPEEEKDNTTNPDTSDIGLVGIIAAIVLASTGLGYTIKKRKFN